MRITTAQRHVGSSCLLALLLLAAAHAASAGRRPLAVETPEATCAVGSWSPFTPCTRMGVHQWSKSHSRSVVTPGTTCPPLTETLACEPARASKPADAVAGAQQATAAVLVTLPLALSSSMSWPQQVPVTNADLTVTQDVLASLAAGRAVWQQQATASDLLTCTPFNGPGQLLTEAAPVVGQQSSAAAVDNRGTAHSQARAAFAAVAADTARQAAAQRRSSTGRSGARMLQPFIDAAGGNSPAQAGGVLPAPSVDATAAVSWDGSRSMAVTIAPAGDRMTPATVQLANRVLQDEMLSMAPWLHVQPARRGVNRGAAPVLQLNMTYDSAAQAATFTTGAGGAGSLLLAIAPQLARAYGLAMGTRDAKSALMRLPATGAVARASAGGGVSQLAVNLAGEWTPASLAAALGVPGAPGREQQAPPAFSIGKPTLLYSAAPSAFYAAMTTSMPSLAVDGQPATLNMRAGGNAALTLFEPCEPAPGLMLSDMKLHVSQDGSLMGSAAGSLAATAVSAVATISGGSSSSSSSSGGNSSGGSGSSSARMGPADALSLVMTAETVAATNLADVITIITHKPPAALLQQLHGQQQQQAVSAQQQPAMPMQFSSVTLTYSHPKARSGQRGAGSSRADAAVEDTGFNMVAVPDVDAAPTLKQMLDAIGLSGDSLALRTAGAMSRSSASAVFALAASEPFVLQLPAPFADPGPTMLSLEVAGSGRAAVADSAVPATAPVLAGSMSAQVYLPGAPAATVLDLHDVAVTTPTAIVGAQAAPAQPQVPVTAHLAGRTVSQVVLGGYPFLDFQPLAVNAAAGFAPSRLLSMSMSGPVSVFGAAGSAVMNATTDLSRRPAGQAQDGPASAQPPMEFAGRVPVMDVPLVARSMGVNVPLGAFAAQLKAARVAYPASPARRAAAAAAGDGAGSGDAGLDVNAELQTCGMSSLVSFAMSGQAGGSFTATFIPFQINRALVPSIQAGITAALASAHKAVTAARAAAGRRVALEEALRAARAQLSEAQQHAAAASAAFEAARQQAANTLGDAAVYAESTSVAYHSAHTQAGAELQTARSGFNRADAAYNQAKMLAYQDLNGAKQAFSDALAKQEAALATAQQRVDALTEQSSRLRVAYNTANSRCTPAPAPASQEQCRAAATAWAEYRAASANLDAAQTALQATATSGASAQQLEAAKVAFFARQAAAEAVLAGAEWVARGEAGVRLEAALQAMQDAERGFAAQRMIAAQAALAQAQQAMGALLTPSANELQALTAARAALNAAMVGVKASTAAASMGADELAAAAGELSSLLAGLRQAGDAAAAANAPAAAARLFKFSSLEFGFDLTPHAPLVLGVSYSGVVAAPDGQRLLSARFQLDMSAAPDDVSALLIELMRNDVLAAVRASRRALSALL